MDGMNSEKLLNNLVYSDEFEDLVVYRLKLLLESSMENMEELTSLKSLDGTQWQDLVDELQYSRSLVTVLSWLTTEDMSLVTIKLNKISYRLDTEF